ncbi:unnamed protein product, partial [Meganyctiphanes norvegica]
EEGRGPVFLHEPPSRLHFSNTTGALLPCSAHGNPKPVVEWLSAGVVVGDVGGVRVVHTNGSLQFLPFAPSAYTAAVHANTYSCRAANTAGIILSRPVHVRAVVRQYYEVQVYDEFVISGNTAVLKCHVPSFVRDYVAVTSWVRGNGERIVSDVLTGGRYSVFGSGELHIRHVTKADEFQSYHCETQHILTGEPTVSAVAGRLMVNEPRSSVPPRITDSRTSVRATVRDTAELPCAAQGYPIPHYQQCYLENQKNYNMLRGQLLEGNGTQLIPPGRANSLCNYWKVMVLTTSSWESNSLGIYWKLLKVNDTQHILTGEPTFSEVAGRMSQQSQQLQEGNGTLHILTGEPKIHRSYWKVMLLEGSEVAERKANIILVNTSSQGTQQSWQLLEGNVTQHIVTGEPTVLAVAGSQKSWVANRKPTESQWSLHCWKGDGTQSSAQASQQSWQLLVLNTFSIGETTLLEGNVTQYILMKDPSVSTVDGRLMVNEPRSSVPPRITDSRTSVRATVRDTAELPCAAQGYPI